MYKNIEDMISNYIEDDISQKEKIIIENYIRENPKFKLKVNGIKNILYSLKKTPILSPSNDFLSNLENRINQEKQSVFNFSYNFKMAITFATFVGLLLVVMLNDSSISKEVALKKNINTDSLVKAEEIDSLKNNDFPIKQVKSNK